MPKIVYWNPRRRLADSGILWRLSRVRRLDNFGDLLGPLIVNRLRKTMNLGRAVSGRQRILTVGSLIINDRVQDGDVIWGSGVHGNLLPLRKPFPILDVRAVRGPLTARLLRETGNSVPDIYGDPALLVPHLWSDSELGIVRRSGGTVRIPNLEDLADAPIGALSPLGDPIEKIRTIASAARVFSSSLHGIIIAEAYGVPAVMVASNSQRLFKYDDYYRGTGRNLPQIADNWVTALDTPAGNPIANWDPHPLLHAFPSEFWAT